MKGDPEVNASFLLDLAETFGLAKIVDRVKTTLNTGRLNASASLNTAFTNTKTRLLEGLKSFDPEASVSYQALEVTPDGIIIRGAIGTRWRRFDPVVHKTMKSYGYLFHGFTALGSWIPGGRIDEYKWSGR